MMHFFQVTVKKTFCAPKRTKTCVECNNIVTTILLETAARFGSCAVCALSVSLGGNENIVYVNKQRFPSYLKIAPDKLGLRQGRMYIYRVLHIRHRLTYRPI